MIRPSLSVVPPKEHQQIIEALKTRSVQEAVDLMTAHLDEVKKNRVIVAAKKMPRCPISRLYLRKIFLTTGAIPTDQRVGPKLYLQ
ncbi:hypothetical protein ACFS07_30280 [Undibacterium arcticum]